MIDKYFNNIILNGYKETEIEGDKVLTKVHGNRIIIYFKETSRRLIRMINKHLPEERQLPEESDTWYDWQKEMYINANIPDTFYVWIKMGRERQRLLVSVKKTTHDRFYVFQIHHIYTNDELHTPDDVFDRDQRVSTKARLATPKWARAPRR